MVSTSKLLPNSAAKLSREVSANEITVVLAVECTEALDNTGGNELGAPRLALGRVVCAKLSPEAASKAALTMLIRRVSRVIRMNFPIDLPSV